MYQIIGTQRNGQDRLVATPKSAREARTHYNAAHALFSSVHINGPDGRSISIDELNRLAEAEDGNGQRTKP